MHDREIALWNARCVYIWTQIYRKWIQIFAPWLLGSPFSNMIRKRFLPKNRLGCRNLRRHSHLQTWWTHIFFFSLFPFLFFLSRMPCLVVSLSAHSCACQEVFSSLSPSTCVEQNAWPGNRVAKCADAYKFRRKCNNQVVLLEVQVRNPDKTAMIRCCKPWMNLEVLII